MTDLSNHSPGPWRVSYGSENDYCVWDEKGNVHQDFLDERAANAVLIGSAPDMLEALKQCKAWFEKHSPTAELITGQKAEHPMLGLVIKPAIDKAEGR